MTPVDSMDTLWLMGMREEFAKAAGWVEKSLTFDQNVNVNLFETTIRQLGGLLAAYGLSRHEGILAKAVDLGSRLFAAFAPLFPTPAAPLAAKDGTGKMGAFNDLMKRMELPQETVQKLNSYFPDDSAEASAVAAPQELPPPQLPSSDVNLGTGELQNL